jgi:YD repeat-containing protein
VSRFTYESSAAGNGSWGRLLTRTTPGGQTQTTSYWPDAATVSLPALCGGASVEVSGQPRTLTRQDGSTVTTYFDIVGRAVAMVSSGGDIVETGCTVYRSDGVLESSTTFVNGEMVEKSEYRESSGGDPRELTAIFTTGPGSSSPAGVVRERTTRVDLLGRPVEIIGVSGETTRTVYDAADNITRMEVVPPAGAQAAPMTFDYSYDRASNLLNSVAVNGVSAARITRDPRTRQITSWDYAGVARVGWGYSPDGRLSSTAPAPPCRERWEGDAPAAASSSRQASTRSPDPG